jgi:type IX secretion system PorP/SprF family membrane protein
MKRILLCTLSYLAVNVSIAQSDKQLTHYMFDKMSYNPATTGFKGYCATVIYRGQWDKVANAPKTMLVNLQGSLPEFNSGVGVSFTNDVIGFGTEKQITLNYAYHLAVPGYGILSGGLGLGIENMGFDPKWDAPQTGTNSSLDQSLPTGAKATSFDANFGLHWQGATMPYYIGLSATHLTQPELTNVNFTKARHYYVMGGYDITSSQIAVLPSDLKITPSFLFKTDGVAGILDFNVLADYWFSYRAGAWAGLTYRTKDAFAIMVGFEQRLMSTPPKNGMLGGAPDVLKIGYSYDIMTGPLNQYGNGSHELILNYCVFAPAKPVRRYGNVFILQ